MDGAASARMEGRFDADAEDMWSALTDLQRLARWTRRVNGDLRPGGAFRATFTSGWEGRGRVDVCDAPRRLLFTAQTRRRRRNRHRGRDLTRGRTGRLVVEERGLPLDEAGGHGAGWQAHIEDLGAHVAGQTPCDWRTRWIELLLSYQTAPTG